MYLVLPLATAWAFFCSDMLLWLGFISERLPPFHLIPIAPLALALVYGLSIDRFCRRLVVKNEYLVCPRCWYSLKALPEEGMCPECGQPYTSAAIRKIWTQVYMGRHGKDTGSAGG